MPLPIPNLDDRRFDDLVAEAITRVEAHTPEWSNIAPGDPGSALIDMFAWLAETRVMDEAISCRVLSVLGWPIHLFNPAPKDGRIRRSPGLVISTFHSASRRHCESAA